MTSSDVSSSCNMQHWYQRSERT